MKKAFTLIEVIISVVLILVIGTSAFFVFNGKSSNKLEAVEDEILNAANLYISVETDDDGKNFLNGINSGGRGVILPLTKLVEKGYLSDKVVETIKEEQGDTAIEDNHVLALLGDGSLNNDCSGVTLTISWDESYTKEVYLCPTSTTSGGIDMPKYGENVKFTFILDPRCARSPEWNLSFNSHEFVTYSYGDDFSFPLDDAVCWNAKGYKWKSEFNGEVYEYGELYNDFWDGWNPRDTVFTMLEVELPKLANTLETKGYEKNKYIPGDSQDNFVSYGGQIFRIYYYGDDGIKLLLDADIGTSKFSNGDGSNYKDIAFHYYDSEIKLETKSYPDLGLSNIKILTQEQRGSRNSSTIKSFLYTWYYNNIDATTITKPKTMYYCTQKNGKKDFTSDLNNCIDANEVGASIPTDFGLLDFGGSSESDYIWGENYSGMYTVYNSFYEYNKPYWLMGYNSTFNKTYSYHPATFYVDNPDSTNGCYMEPEDSFTINLSPNKELAVRPVIMLDSNVEFVRGTGTRNDPYFIL